MEGLPIRAMGMTNAPLSALGILKVGEPDPDPLRASES
jgi:hypothetical protein